MAKELFTVKRLLELQRAGAILECPNPDWEALEQSINPNDQEMKDFVVAWKEYTAAHQKFKALITAKAVEHNVTDVYF